MTRPITVNDKPLTLWGYFWRGIILAVVVIIGFTLAVLVGAAERRGASV